MAIHSAIRLPLLVAAIAGFSLAANATTIDYILDTTIPIAPLGSPLTSFDISFVDGQTGIYYFADRSNKSVDIINGATNTVIGQAPGFVGLSPAGTSQSGPDGVVVVHNG